MSPLFGVILLRHGWKIFVFIQSISNKFSNWAAVHPIWWSNLNGYFKSGFDKQKRVIPNAQIPNTKHRL